MSFWDNVKKFTQPYADDDYDDYDESNDAPPTEPLFTDLTSPVSVCIK